MDERTRNMNIYPQLHHVMCFRLREIKRIEDCFIAETDKRG